MFATERNLQPATRMVEAPHGAAGNLMKNESKEPPKTDRIAGTLHKPGYVPSASRRDANLPREKAEEGEVAGRHGNTGQKDHKGAR